MTAHPTAEHLAALLDGTASEEVRAQIDDHLPDCQLCRAELDELRRTVDLIKVSETRKATTGWYDEWRKKTYGSGEVVLFRERLRRIWKPGPVMAAAAAVVILLLVYPAYLGVFEREGDWAGSVESLILMEDVRLRELGVEPMIPTLGKGKPYSLLLLQSPDWISPSGTYEIDIHDESGESVFSMRIAGGDLKAAEETELGLMPLLIPTSKFRPGDYRLVFTRVDKADPDASMTRDFEVPVR